LLAAAVAGDMAENLADAGGYHWHNRTSENGHKTRH
jgi:hypothetical protein